jgi:hypothetical protein
MFSLRLINSLELRDRIRGKIWYREEDGNCMNLLVGTDH